MPPQYHPRGKEKGSGLSLSRRDLLKLAGWGAFGVGASAIINATAPWWVPPLFRAVPPLSDWAIYTKPEGKELEGGAILEDKSDFASQYAQVVENEDMRPNASLLRSIVYHVSHDHGLSDELARTRANKIYLTKKEEGTIPTCESGCTFNSKEGIVVSIGFEDLISYFQNIGWSKKRTLLMVNQAVAHEASHGAVVSADTDEHTEDYGSLGVFKNLSSFFGFQSRGSLETGKVKGLFTYNSRFNNYGELINFKVNPLEEFFAVWSENVFGRSLIGIGLEKSESARTYYDSLNIAYPFLVQAITDAFDTLDTSVRVSWQSWWEGALLFDAVKYYHTQNERYPFLKTIGEVMVRKNPYQPVLENDDLAAYGLLSFFAWLHVGNPNHYVDPRPVFTNLLYHQITPTYLQQQAQELIRWREKLQKASATNVPSSGAEKLFTQAGVPVVSALEPTATPPPVSLPMQAWLRPFSEKEWEHVNPGGTSGGILFTRQMPPLSPGSLLIST